MNTTRFNLNQISEAVLAIVRATPNAVVVRWDREDKTPRGFKLPGDVEVHIAYDQYKHRWNISGGWPQSRVVGEERNYSCCFAPHNVYPAQPSTSISISAEKEIAVIAREIQKRFMPGYLAVLKLCLEKRQNHEDYMARQTNAADDLAHALGVGRARVNGEKTLSLDLPKAVTNGNAHGSVCVSGTSVTFEIRSLELAKAIKLIGFLKAL
jgi:hypothetical protein